MAKPGFKYIKLITWKKRPIHWNPEGEMDHLKGKVIRAIPYDDQFAWESLHEEFRSDIGSWLFTKSDVVEQSTQEEFNKSWKLNKE